METIFLVSLEREGRLIEMRILCCICGNQAVQMIDFKFVCESTNCLKEVLK